MPRKEGRMWETLRGVGLDEGGEREDESPLEYSVVGKKEALGKKQIEGEGEGEGGGRRR